MFYISIILIVLSFVLFLTSLRSKDSDYRVFGSPASKVVGILGLVMLVLSSIRTVPAGYVGVQTLFGTVDNQPLTAGLHFVNPLKNMVTIPFRTMEYTMVARSSEGAEHGDDSIPLFTKDTMRLNADVTVIYRVAPEYVPWLYRTIGKAEDFERKVIRPSSRSAFRQGALKYTMLEQLGDKRAALENDIQELIIEAIDNITKNSLDYKGGAPFIIQEVLVRNIEPPDSFKKAVENKLVADQRAQEMKYVLERERQEAIRKSIEAQGIADYQRIVRQGMDEQILRWKGIEATIELAKSSNSKVIVVGSGKDGLPLILGNQ